MAESLRKQVRGAVNVTFGKYNGYVYFFHEDGTYSRFNRLTCELEYYAETAKNWPGWPAHWKCPQAALTWDSQWAYFLQGPDYTRYDLHKDQGDTVESVERYWPRWPKHWLDRVDAGLYWGHHENNRRKAYFFRGDEYLRYDLKDDRVEDGYPVKTRAYWPGWPASWKEVTAAIDWGNGKVYFFSKTEYLRYDKFHDRVDDGYPRPWGDFVKEHQDKLEEEKQSLLFENQIPAGVRVSFVAAVRAIAKQADIRPNWLMASMWMEGGGVFDPKAGLAAGNFIGLHQMSKDRIYQHWGKRALQGQFPELFQAQKVEFLTAEAKRVLVNKFAELGFDQIHVVGAWLRGAITASKKKCRSFDQLRLVGFGGFSLAEIDSTALASVVPQGNPRYDLSKDGKMDVAEFRAAVFDILHEDFRSNPAADSAVRHALG